MRHPHNAVSRILSLTIALLTLASSLEAQTGDWQTVKDLPPGITVTVKTKRKFSCIFQYATEEELVCEGQRHFRSFSRSFPRAEVREVRRFPNPDQRRDAKIGAGIGAATFAAIVAVNCSTKRVDCPAPAFDIPVCGLIGAYLGMLIGMTAPIFQLLRHPRGKVIYKR